MKKVWGIKKNLYTSKTTEVDLLTLKKDTYCSIHYHEHKYNQFNVVEGRVRIDVFLDSNRTQQIIVSAGESYTVHAPKIHRFAVLEDSVMIEVAYALKGKFDPDDIVRLFQGGKVINGREVAEKDLKKCQK